MTVDISQKSLDIITKFNLLHYFGSRHQAIKVLKKYFQPFTQRDQIYFDPFMGSLILPFNLNPKSVVINDLNHDLYNFWQCVKNHKEELAKEMEYVWIGEDWFNEYKIRTDNIGRAVFFYISHLNNKGYENAQNEKIMNYHKVPTLIKDFSAWKEWFDTRISCKILNLDFRKILEMIEGYDSSEKLTIYCDPPFFKQGKQYRFSFIERDHLDLNQILLDLKPHKNIHILMSYDDDPFIRNLYKDFYIKEVSFHVGAGKVRSVKKYHELLISNRPFKIYTQNVNKTQIQSDFSNLIVQ